jgi:hypothetical protein
MFRRGVALSVATIALFISSSAFAQETPSEPSPPPPSSDPSGATIGASTGIGEQPETPPEPKEGGDERFSATVDTVIGFGVTPTVNQKIVGPTIFNETRSTGNSRFVAGSMNLGLGYKLNERIRFGAILPLGVGQLYPGEDTRGTTTNGNLALGGEYSVAMKKGLELSGGLDVALPTASGDELPDNAFLANSGHVDQTGYDRFSLNKAFSASRGREDTALFAPKHLGLVPKVDVIYKGISKLELEAYVKYESLHATGTNVDYEGALVVLGRGSYLLNKYIDGTVRLWTNVPVAGPDSTVVVAEPQIRGHFGAVMPLVGVVLPIVGDDLVSPYTVGVRAAVAARF